ncbi:MAG TPA: HAMP domain-containing protein [Polyangium sp.]|nr:HAMP domain-containing protein [Polyangium sp.]
MSDASAPAPNSPPKTGRQQRRLRNYLLDKRFQLKYAGLLAAVAIGVSAIFGFFLWTKSQQLVLQGQDMVKQGQETVRRGQLAITERKKVNAVVAMNITKAYGDDPDLAKEFKDQTDDSKLEEEQKRLEADAAALEKQAADLKSQAITLFLVIVGALAVLVVCIALAGIVVTHKVAGPVFKMQRMFGQVGDGHFAVRERLRKGDEMQTFFEAFEKMLGRLREIQGQDMERIDKAIASIEGSASSDAVAMLKKLRADMQTRRDG